MSSDAPRLRRQPPARTGPHRDFSKLFRKSDSWNPDAPDARETPVQGGNSAADEKPWDGAVARAVEMGYRVIEAQIAQGRDAAQSLAQKFTNPKSEDGEVSNLIGRLAHFYTDMGALWIEMLQSLARNPALLNVIRSASSAVADTKSDSTARPAAAPQSVSLPVEIISSAPTGARVAIKLDDDAGGDALSVYELREADPGKPPLRDLVFDPGADRWRPTLRITIPGSQPPGTYSGAITDARTNEPCGTLCVRIPPAVDGAPD